MSTEDGFRRALLSLTRPLSPILDKTHLLAHIPISLLDTIFQTEEEIWAIYLYKDPKRLSILSRSIASTLSINMSYSESENYLVDFLEVFQTHKKCILLLVESGISVFPILRKRIRKKVEMKLIRQSFVYLLAADYRTCVNRIIEDVKKNFNTLPSPSLSSRE